MVFPKTAFRYIFASLHLLTALTELAAQSDSLQSIQLDNVLIEGNRLSTSFRESSRTLSVITSHDIATLPVQSIPEVLSYVPGVDIRQRGPMGVQADIGIRGGSFEQTLVLINGIKLTDPQTGHHSLNVPLNISTISQIEVLKGTGARIYGQNAFSGAVNFISRVPDSRYAGVRFYAGQNSLYGGNLELSVPTGKFRQYLSFAHDNSAGYRHNTDFKISNVFYQNEYEIGQGKMEILASWIDRDFGANGFYASPDFTEQYEVVTTSLFSADYSFDTYGLKLKTRIYWRRNRDNYFFVRDNPEVYENLHFTNVFAGEINGVFVSSFGETGFGVEYRKELINGDWVRGGIPSKSNLDGFQRGNAGMFLEHHVKLYKFNITPGIYISHYNDFGWNAFPGMDIGYSLTPNMRIYANAGKAYRIPTFYDMYYESPIEKGNPELVPEEAVNYELGIRYMKNGLSAEANIFRQDASKLIDWVQTPSTDSTFYWQAMNFSNINRTGIELSTHWDLVKLTGKPFLIRRINLSYNYIQSDLLEQDIISRYSLENLQHQVIFGINHHLIWQIFHNFRVRFSRRIHETPYWLLDSRIYWTPENNTSIFIEATNWSNTNYTEIMTPMPGRWFRAGITYKLGF
jgi:iron complex outermembrane receptor protein